MFYKIAPIRFQNNNLDFLVSIRNKICDAVEWASSAGGATPRWVPSLSSYSDPEDWLSSRTVSVLRSSDPSDRRELDIDLSLKVMVRGRRGGRKGRR